MGGDHFMEENDIENEARLEFKKNMEELVKDIIREANTLPKGQPASEKENLDIIKHLIKRLAVHQISLDNRAKKINILLIILSFIMTIGAIFSILSFFYRP